MPKLITRIEEALDSMAFNERMEVACILVRFDQIIRLEQEMKHEYGWSLITPNGLGYMGLPIYPDHRPASKQFYICTQEPTMPAGARESSI